MYYLIDIIIVLKIDRYKNLDGVGWDMATTFLVARVTVLIAALYVIRIYVRITNIQPLELNHKSSRLSQVIAANTIKPLLYAGSLWC